MQKFTGSSGNAWVKSAGVVIKSDLFSGLVRHSDTGNRHTNVHELVIGRAGQDDNDVCERGRRIDYWHTGGATTNKETHGQGDC